MALYYKPIGFRNPNGGALAWTAKIVSTKGIVGLEDLVQHMAAHNLPYSEGVIRAVVSDFVGCVRELCLDGAQVKVPNLAIFSVRAYLKSWYNNYDDVLKYGPDTVRLHVRGTGRFTSTEIWKQAKLSKLPQHLRYSVDEQQEQETPQP